ncbi:uncharacterized protein PgNI_11623 [Pyricularia grisea]|uniref:Uncharacterized protein n=1 Tax=Pyricularia grisea TaxID=148305 RepID=A0A6P8AP53_PYRGI|nr:uncharacterized protein PgNI_11623 [Pyricularia grisea]TLD03798.1 hypothetical protein PgNI_11623 [Pyricularia grisea]
MQSQICHNSGYPAPKEHAHGIWWTCKGNATTVPFLGCCTKNPCSPGSCTLDDLVPAHLSEDRTRASVFLGSLQSSATAPSPKPSNWLEVQPALVAINSSNSSNPSLEESPAGFKAAQNGPGPNRSQPQYDRCSAVPPSEPAAISNHSEYIPYNRNLASSGTPQVPPSNRPAATSSYPGHVPYNPKLSRPPTLFPNAAVLVEADGNFAPEPNDTANCPTHHPPRPVGWPTTDAPARPLRNIPQNAGNPGSERSGFDFGMTMVPAERTMGFGPQIAGFDVNQQSV